MRIDQLRITIKPTFFDPLSREIRVDVCGEGRTKYSEAFVYDKTFVEGGTHSDQKSVLRLFMDRATASLERYIDAHEKQEKETPWMVKESHRLSDQV